MLKNPLIAGLLFFVLSSVCVLGLTAAWQIFDLPPVVINLPATRVPSSLRVTPTSKGVQIQTPTATSATPRQMTRTPTLASLPKEYLVQPGTLLWTTISDISAAPETGTALLPGTKGQKVNVDGEIQVNSRVYWHICEQKEKNPWCGYMIAPGLKPRPAVTKTSVLPTFAPTVAPSLTLSPDDEFIFGASSDESATPSPTTVSNRTSGVNSTTPMTQAGPFGFKFGPVEGILTAIGLIAVVFLLLAILRWPGQARDGGGTEVVFGETRTRPDERKNASLGDVFFNRKHLRPNWKPNIPAPNGEGGFSMMPYWDWKDAWPVWWQGIWQGFLFFIVALLLLGVLGAVLKAIFKF